MANEKRSRLHYWGEAIKEVGILISVFGPMYLNFEAKETGLSFLADSAMWVACGMMAVGVGVELERKY